MNREFKHPAYVKPANGRGFWVIADGKPVKNAFRDTPKVFKTKGDAEYYAKCFNAARA